MNPDRPLVRATTRAGYFEVCPRCGTRLIDWCGGDETYVVSCLSPAWGGCRWQRVFALTTQTWGLATTSAGPCNGATALNLARHGVLYTDTCGLV